MSQWHVNSTRTFVVDMRLVCKERNKYNGEHAFVLSMQYYNIKGSYNKYTQLKLLNDYIDHMKMFSIVQHILNKCCTYVSNVYNVIVWDQHIYRIMTACCIPGIWHSLKHVMLHKALKTTMSSEIVFAFGVMSGIRNRIHGFRCLS